MMEKIMSSPIAWAVLSIITIASFIFAVICQRKNKEKKEFSFCKLSYSLIRNKKSKFEKLSIEYDEKPVDSLCMSEFIIWNSGNKTINSSDMVNSKEITIYSAEDSEILDVEIIAYTEETNNFIIQLIDSHTVKLLFDYVDVKDGLAVQIIHTGTADCIRIDSKIKGGKPIKEFVKNRVPSVFRKMAFRDTLPKIMLVFFLSMVLLLLVFALLMTISIFNSQLKEFMIWPYTVVDPQLSQRSSIISSVILWIYGIVILISVIPTLKRAFHIGIPSALKKYSNYHNM